MLKDPHEILYLKIIFVPILKKAIYFMILSAGSFTIMNLFVKYLQHFSAPQLIFFRSLGSLFFTLPFLWYHNIPVLGNKRGLLLARALAGVTSMGLFFWSIHYLPIGSAVSLRYLAPVLAALLAVLFLKEKVKNIQWLFFIIAFSGVLMIKGFDSAINTLGLILVLLSAFFSGGVYVLISKIGSGDHPVVIVNYFMSIAVVIGGVLSLFYWERTPVGMEWVLLSSLGCFGYFGQLFMTKAFQSQVTNKVVSLKYIEVIFTMIGGMIWFGDVYPVLSLLGTAMVITGLVLNIFYK